MEVFFVLFFPASLTIFTSWTHSAGDGGADAIERVILVAWVHTETGIDLSFYELPFFLNSLTMVGLKCCHLLIEGSAEGQFFSFYFCCSS